MSNDSEAGTPPVQSVDRALTILEILARRREAGVTELGRELGVHKSTAFRLLAALESRGFVEQAQDRGSYRLGLGIVRIAGAVAAQLDVSRQGLAACERLATELGETVNIAIMDSGRAVNVTQSRGSAAITSHDWVGKQTPLHATSSGKVLLAFAFSPVLSGLERFTASTIVDSAELARELDRVRAMGWASTAEEFEVGLNAVAAPIRGADGSVIAALSVSGPAYRLIRSSFPEVAKQVIAAADEVGARMGWV
ncbi:MAG TPA: IclR family transcriptional regulator [Actinoplanes sp.]|nr:IclR family transcriptional regulator [Actinoplanes sp.]